WRNETGRKRGADRFGFRGTRKGVARKGARNPGDRSAARRQSWQSTHRRHKTVPGWSGLSRYSRRHARISKVAYLRFHRRTHGAIVMEPSGSLGVAVVHFGHFRRTAALSLVFDRWARWLRITGRASSAGPGEIACRMKTKRAVRGSKP